ncbi:MAG: ABC transporter ATP-binding protein [Pseudomonadota bacterium]
MSAISVSQLCKSYDGRQAVQDLSFEVQKGETFALLGPNGAGKTTTIEILEGYRQADSGSVSVLGLDPEKQAAELKRRTGLVLQTTALEPELTIRETITAFARLYRAPRDIAAVLVDVNLAHLQHNRVGNLSGGQKRRLEIALGIVGDPELIFLDEPTTGLDPEARRKIWTLIQRLNNNGCTIVLSSHYMDEVQALASRMAIMVDGQIAAEGRPRELQRQHCTHSTIRFDADGKLPAGFPAKLAPITTVHDGHAELVLEDPAPALGILMSWAEAEGHDLSSISVTRQNLEDIYLQLVSQRQAKPQGAAP